MLFKHMIFLQNGKSGESRIFNERLPQDSFLAEQINSRD